jgi:tetratricopeptide (TPR) repeat protein
VSKISGPEAAQRLMVGARARLVAGDLAGAGHLVEEAAAAWREAGEPDEEARCLRLASTLVRHAGNPDLAVALAERAVAAAPVGASYQAAGTAALAAGDAASAVTDFETALADAPAGELRATLEQGYASALLATGRVEEAVAAFRRPGTVLSLVDGVGQLQLAGYTDLAEQLATEAEAAAGGDHAVASSLALLAAGRALDRRDPGAARSHAERARAEALAGRSVAGYVSAAVALAGLADAAGDRIGAYASLAVGWATLRDLVGADGARAAFRPPLLALRDQWGTAAFAAAKAGYESKVRDG